jgi:hypothetical protein
MSTIADTVAGIQDQVLDTITAAQDPIVEAVTQLTETVAGFLPEQRPTVPFADQFPTLTEVVELSYGFAERVLQNQHELATSLVDAVSPLFPQATAAAKPAKPKIAA